MTKLLPFLIVFALVALAPAAQAEGVSISRGPITCTIPLDSLNIAPCDAAKTSGHSGECAMEGTRNGKPYTVTLHVTGHSIPRQQLPPLKNGEFGRGALRCQVTSSEPVTGVCNVGHADESGGSGSCIYCTPTGGCHQGSASIRIREKKPGETANAN
jgi:hypothetical protein